MKPLVKFSYNKKAAYKLTTFYLACLKDLKKAIRVDSEHREKTVLNTIAQFNVIETDIVPLMLSFEGQSTEVANRFILACGKKKKKKKLEHLLIFIMNSGTVGPHDLASRKKSE
jgi:hypothetical protein